VIEDNPLCNDANSSRGVSYKKLQLVKALSQIPGTEAVSSLIFKDGLKNKDQDDNMSFVNLFVQPQFRMKNLQALNLKGC
jgi:hypothetical protein